MNRPGLAALLLLLGLGRLAAADDLAARVVVLANSRQPESVKLAEFYAAQRGVPAANIVALPMPEAESITWREFIDQVWQPVQDELGRRGWLDGTGSKLVDALGRRRVVFSSHRISYLVTCRGVPLRIHHDPTLVDEKVAAKLAAPLRTTEAAVDSELSLLAWSNHDITGMVPNPWFNTARPPALDAALIVKVSRLDGPSWDSARHLVTSALEAERTGLTGRAYVDLGGPDKEGDKWFEATLGELQALGFDTTAERSGATFGTAARFDAPVLYFGWYASTVNGPFTRPGFRFPPGAVALHLHSFSAQTLRSETSGWCGPFIARGVTATVGNVFEPYLALTHRPQLLLQALAEGRTFGDAVYQSLPALSWEAIAIGDPLYRPFKVSLEAQLAAGSGLSPLAASYAVVRRAIQLERDQQPAEALALLKSAARRQPTLPLALALAARLAGAKDDPGVQAALGFAPLLKDVRPEDWPLLREAAALLAAHGGRVAALTVYARLAAAPAPDAPALRELLNEARQVADAAGDLTRSLQFARQLNELDPAAAK